MILKLLLVIAVITAVYFMFFKKKPIQNKTNTKKENMPESNEMIECSNCGVYSEIDECILSNAKYYCSPECAHKAQ